ncbi:MAG: carboxypeptidase regulatory-like domain-containing protein, partial [Planctomycetota bacterium]
MSSKTVVAVVLCVAAGLLLWWWPAQSRAQLDSASLIGGNSLQGLDSQSGNMTGLEAPQDAWSRDTAGPLTRRPRLAGRVVDSSGAALAGVSVSFSSESGFSAPGVETDVRGHFERELDAEPAGDAPIEALAESVEHCDTTAIVTTREESTIVMTKLPRIEVRVVGPEGLAPAGSGNVKLLLRDLHGTRTTSLELDEDGIARSDPVQPGQLLRVSSTFDGFASNAVARNDELNGDATLRVDVTLARGVSLRGTVLDESTHRPLSGVVVRAVPCFPLTWADAPSATSDGSGYFELRAVTASTFSISEDESVIELYRVNVEIDGFALTAPRSQVWKHRVGTPQPAAIDNIELLLVPTGSLIVKLRWPDGRQVGNYNLIRVFDSTGNVSESSRFAGDESGFSKVPAGELHLIARARNPRGLAQADLSLRVGEVRRIELTLQAPDAAIDGRVVDARGRGVPGIQLNAGNVIEISGRRTSLDWIGTSTDAQGHFHVEPLYAGSCEMSSEGEDGAMSIAIWPPQRRLELEAASIATGVDFRAEPALL